MKSVIIIFITGIIFLTCSYSLYSQKKTNAEIQNVDFEFINKTFFITYDIVDYRKKETFNVSVNIYTASNKKIAANSFEGDINNNVTGGKNKKIKWCFERDNIFLDESIYIEVLAKPEKANKGKFSEVLNSILSVLFFFLY